MPESSAQTPGYKPLRAPRGPQLSCKGWAQEALLRMFLNGADPAVAENPRELMVSGGIGKLARDWTAFAAIADALQALDGDQTLVIRNGEAATILHTTAAAPRAVVLNSVPRSAGEHATARFASNWFFTGAASALPEAYEVFRAAARRHFGGTLAGRLVASSGMGGMGGAQALAATLNGAAFLGIDADAERIKRRVKSGYCEVMVNNLDEALRILKNAVRRRTPASVGLIANAAELIPELADRGVLPDLLTDQTPGGDSLAYIPTGLTPAEASKLRAQDPGGYRQRALDSIAAQVRGMLALKGMGAVVFEFGNGLRAQAAAHGVASASEISHFAEYLQADLAQGRGLFTIIALSGDSGDLARIDTLFADLFPATELAEWIAIARRHAAPGLSARSCWISRQDAATLGAAINDLVAQGRLKAPVVIGRSIAQEVGTRGDAAMDSQAPHSAAAGPAHGVDAGLIALLEAASGSIWLGCETHEDRWEIERQSISFAALADGARETPTRIARLLGGDFEAALVALQPPRQDRA